MESQLLASSVLFFSFTCPRGCRVGAMRSSCHVHPASTCPRVAAESSKVKGALSVSSPTVVYLRVWVSLIFGKEKQNKRNNGIFTTVIAGKESKDKNQRCVYSVGSWVSF